MAGARPQGKAWTILYICNGREIFRDTKGAGIPEPRGMVARLPPGDFLLGATVKCLATRRLFTACLPVVMRGTGEVNLARFIREDPDGAYAILVMLAGSPEIALMAAAGWVGIDARPT